MRVERGPINVRHVQKSCSCLHCCSISGGGGTTNGVHGHTASIRTNYHGGPRLKLSNMNTRRINYHPGRTHNSRIQQIGWCRTVTETFSGIPSWISATFRRKNLCKQRSARSLWNVLRLPRVYIIFTNMTWGLTAHSSQAYWLSGAKSVQFLPSDMSVRRVGPYFLFPEKVI